MKIMSKVIYGLFIVLLFVCFVFFGGGRALIYIGNSMVEWELSMKENFGYFCSREEKKIKKRSNKVSNAL